MDDQEYESGLSFFLNGEAKCLLSVDPRTTLLQFLRGEGLTGTKLGCGEGGCGACTAIVSSIDSTGKPRHLSVNTCLTPLCTIDGCSITTIEGLGGTKSQLHPIQERVSSSHGSQCGFCTPGIVMSVCAQLKCNPDSTPHDLEDCLDGNLCRCTGYRPIIDAVKSLSRNKGEVDVTRDISGTLNPDGEVIVHNSTERTMATSCGIPEDVEYDKFLPIVPSKLSEHIPRAIMFSKGDIKWYQPVTMSALFRLKDRFPSARIIVGNTEIGIETKFKNMEYSVYINPSPIRELQIIEREASGLRVGGAVTINRLRQFISSLEPTNPTGFEKRGFVAIYHMFSWFASNQIRNVASIAGNIVTASPISDLNPMLLACGATFRLSSSAGTRDVYARDFFISYRKVALEPNEILESVLIPFTSSYEFIIPFKQARRREDDISIVTAGVRVVLDFNEGAWVVKDFSAGYGGLSVVPILATKTMTALVGKPWCIQSIEEAYRITKEEFTLPDVVPGGQAQYRTALAATFIFKTFFIVTAELRVFLEAMKRFDLLESVPTVADVDESAADSFVTSPKIESRGEQVFSVRKGGMQSANPVPHTPDEQASRDIVGSSIMHKSATLQVSGEAVYTDDAKLPSDALHAALVTSTRVHAKILKVDLSVAENCEGFVGYFDHKNVRGDNKIGAVVKDEYVFVVDEVKHYGAVIGVIVANTHEQASYAAKKVIVEYEDLPAIISIDDAIAANSFFEVFPPNPERMFEHEICDGSPEDFLHADIVVEGTNRVGGQDHFYLETNCSVITLTEQGSLEILSSTQAPTKTQKCCAAVCGLPAAKVVAKCKRMGGGFGGKETRSVFIACAAAVAAQALNKTVSINIERDLDMSITGQRHAFLLQYRAGCTKEGKLKFLDARLYNNAGFSLDLSQAVMDRALFHSDSAYKWPAFRVIGTVCKTNQPSHTAFRGFGGPQGLMVSEIAIEHLARASGIDPIILRSSNMYVDGDRTPFGETLENFYLPKMWKEIQEKADYTERKVAVERFNESNRWKKRGIFLLPTKFGINFTAKFMNQGGALVHVYIDGTVLVSHGGTEMGQGLHTKIIQVAANSFGIPHENVHIAETATNTVANTSPTAASMSTDLYGMAVLDACEQIKSRLSVVRSGMPPTSTWLEVVESAFYQRVDLSAHGYYAVDSARCGYDWNIQCTDNSLRGMPFNYFTQGVACCEVEIDCLTGDSFIVRADINMDVGKSINPVLDIGQIEGAFVQGFGWSTMEELVWGDSDHRWVRPGQLFTKGPGTYKIPAFNDVPKDFRVYLSDTENKFCVHSSKAIGEPPFFLGASGFFAIHEAINAFRRPLFPRHDFFMMDLPATTERIRMSCPDAIAQLCTDSNISFRPKGSW